MKRIKKWLVNRAPIWARVTLQENIKALEAENNRLRTEIVRLNAYIQGLQYATRALRRITINTGPTKEVNKHEISEQ